MENRSMAFTKLIPIFSNTFDRLVKTRIFKPCLTCLLIASLILLFFFRFKMRCWKKKIVKKLGSSSISCGQVIVVLLLYVEHGENERVKFDQIPSQQN